MPVNKKQIANQWLKYALESIRARIKKLKVIDSGDLLASVDGNVSEEGKGKSYRAEIFYNYYGIYPDQGLGRGSGKGDQTVNKMAGAKGRKKKNWTKEIAEQRHRFGEIMGKAYADEHEEKITGSLRKKQVMKF